MKRSLYDVLTCVVLSSLLGLSSCRSPVESEPEVLFETDRASYAVGDTAILIVTNLGPSVVAGSVHCILEVERQSASGWDFASKPTTVSVCTGFPKLEPGLRHERELEIAPVYFQAAGEYRFKTPYFNEGRTRMFVVTSSSFTVEE